MASVPLPEGLTEADYEAIEAAVTETVRGRWFLSEFARRNRSGEMRQILDAVGRLETSVTAQQALPSADPSVRLLIQRIKEVAGQLDTLAAEMREAGVEESYADAVGRQARAVAGMMRGGAALPMPPAAPSPEPTRLRLPRATPLPEVGTGEDPRLGALSGLDRMSLAEKLALFS